MKRTILTLTLLISLTIIGLIVIKKSKGYERMKTVWDTHEDEKYDNSAWPEFFQEHVCSCKRVNWSYLNGGMANSAKDNLWWQSGLTQFGEPPLCLTCGKWQRDKLRICGHCHEYFYAYFRHPMMPIDWREGHWCWNCIVLYRNTLHTNYGKMKAAKPDPMILPPGYVLAVREIPQGVSDAVAKARKLMAEKRAKLGIPSRD